MIIAHKQPIGKEITCSAIASQNRAFFRSSLSAVSLADWRSKPLPIQFGLSSWAVCLLLITH
ncbi:MAG: hypothetical protein RID09_08300 [Coleofasciculus sp. G1-WW12-02]